MPKVAAGGVFLSYRREDRHFAGRLADSLVGRFGASRVFLDVDAIEPGADFASAIEDAVSKCDVLIAIIGPSWIGLADSSGRRRLDDPNDFVALEVEAALTRGIRVIPVLIDDASTPQDLDLPPRLRGLARRQAVEVEYSSFHSDLGRIVSVVSGALDEAASGGQAQDRRTDVPARADVGRNHSGPRALPLSRVSVRTALWWMIFILSTSACVGLTTTVMRGPGVGGVMGAVMGETFLLSAIFGLAFRLRREIAAQREMLRFSDLEPRRVASASRPLRHSHIRLVTAICVVVSVAFSAAVALTPGAVPR